MGDALVAVDTGLFLGDADLVHLGAALFWYAARTLQSHPGTRAHEIWVGSQEPICAGLIAGAALIGIGDILVKVFVLS